MAQHHKDESVFIRLTAKAHFAGRRVEKNATNRMKVASECVHDTGVKLQCELARRNITLGSLAQNPNAKNEFRCAFRLKSNKTCDSFVEQFAGT
jgi:hypothetical protein